MNFKLSPSLLLGAILLSPISAHTASSPEYLYKEAQIQETTSRDPESAIRLYSQFLKQPGTDRAMQASATLHLGLCLAQLGQTDKAKSAWKKVVQDYSDQSESYAEALNQLQKLQALEQSEVRASSPIIKVIYESPPARWMLEFPKATFPHTIDSKGRLTSTASGLSLAVSHFPEPDLGVMMEAGSLGSYRPMSTSRDIGFFNVSARAERTITSGFRLYATGGPGIYLFKFSNEQDSESKVNLGASLGAGLVVGMPRGFTFNFGYVLHAFGQSTPSADFQSSIPPSELQADAEILQNRGIRLAGGPVVALSFRW